MGNSMSINLKIEAEIEKFLKRQLLKLTYTQK